MVTQSELLVSRVLGLSRSDIRPMACSLDVLVELLFVERIPLGDILVTKHVYPKVARRLENHILPLREAPSAWPIAGGIRLWRKTVFPSLSGDPLMKSPLYARYSAISHFFFITESHSSLSMMILTGLLHTSPLEPEHLSAALG